MKFDSIIIIGATATGKTAFSVSLAKALNGEIINADSQQIYKNLNIGTAKITPQEMQGINHHLFDLIDVGQNFSVSDFKHLAINTINQLKAQNKLPIIVGGTGFYVESLLYDLEFGNIQKDESLRSYYVQLAKDNGNEYVYNILKELDIKSAEKLHPNDLNRVIRAIEIAKLSNTKKSQQIKKDAKILNPLIIELYMDRAVLYEKINLRVDIMLKNGLLKEVQWLNNNGFFGKKISLPIGYSEWKLYLNGEKTQQEVIDLIKQHSRNYAKRQITWFKRYNAILKFDLTNTNISVAVDNVVKKFNN